MQERLHYKVVVQEWRWPKNFEGSSEGVWREHWREMASLPPSSSPPGESSFRYWGSLLDILKHIWMQLKCQVARAQTPKDISVLAQEIGLLPSEVSEGAFGFHVTELLSRLTCTARRRPRCLFPPWTGSHRVRWGAPTDDLENHGLYILVAGWQVCGGCRYHSNSTGRGQVHHHHWTCPGRLFFLPHCWSMTTSSFNMDFQAIGSQLKKNVFACVRQPSQV